MAQCRVNQHGGDPNPLDTTGLCLLSLDGGGVRGLSTLYILKNIMDRLNSRRNDDKLQEVKPCEVFDLIGGTSTGGLIAIMLGRLEMSVDECIVAYSNLTEMVFAQKLSRTPFDLTGKVKAQFDSAQLGAAIDNVVAQCGASDTDLFDDGTSRGCRTFVCSIDHHTKDMVRLRSYDLPHEPKIRATICQAALATSAATTFFEPVNIGDRRFADGGFGANNPVDEVEGEASNIWCHETGDLKPLVKCFISIGTGNPGKKAFEDSLFKFLTKTVVGIATETEQTDKKFNARWAKHYDDKRYFRFNVEQGLQDVGLEEYKKKGTIEAASYEYLTHTAQKFRVRDCIQNLSFKQSRTATNFPDVITEFNERCKMVERHLVAFSLKGIPAIDHFVQRDQDMRKLEDFFFNQTSQPVRRKVFVVHGLGGIGKTQLCIEFARKHQAQYTAVLWMDGSSEDALQQSFVKVFPMLPADEMSADLVEAVKCQRASPELVVKTVLDWLSLPSNQGWLHIIDNVDHDLNAKDKDPSAYDLRKYSAQGDHGSLLITSRLSTLAVPQNAHQLTQMNPGEARALFEDHRGKPVTGQPDRDESKDLESLLRKLEGMPLALAQAGAYIRETNMSISEYLGHYNSTWDDLIEAQDLYPLQEYAQRSMLTTWMISYHQVESQNREAATLLKLWAFLDPKDLWYELIACAIELESEVDIPEWLSTLAKNRLKFRGALGFLKKYSLVNNGDNDNYSMHAVLHSWCRHLASMSSTSEAFLELAVYVVTQMLPGSSDKGCGALWKRLLPHGHQLLYQLRLGMTWTTSHVSPEIYEGLSDLFNWNRAFEEAAEVLEHALEKGEKIYGEEDLRTLRIAFSLADAYFNIKRYTEAQQLAEHSLAVYQKLLISHPGLSAIILGDMTRTFDFLGTIHEDQMRLEDAEGMFKRTMALFEQQQQQQQEQEQTGTAFAIYAMIHLGDIYLRQSRLTEAEVILGRALEVSSKFYKPDHRHTLKILVALSEVYYELGKVVEAEEMAKRAAAGLDNMIPEDYNHTTSLVPEKLRLLKRQGKFAEATVLAEQVITENKARSGPEHRDTLESTLWLADLHNENNKLQEARTLYEQLIPKYEDEFGLRNRYSLAMMENLASIYIRDIDMLSEAEELFKRVIAGREKSLGPNHIDTLRVNCQLANLYNNNNRLQEARILYEQLIPRLEATFGPLHDWSLGVMGNLAYIYEKKFNMLFEAEELFKRALTGREESLGPNHIATLDSVYNLGAFYGRRGDNDRNVELLKQLLLGFKNTLGPDHERTLDAGQLLRQALGSSPSEFSLTSRDIMLDGDFNLVASCQRVDGSWTRNSISLNDLLENQGGRFVWNKRGNFVATARNIRFSDYGIVLAAELVDEHGVWKDARVDLDERIANHDGTLTFVGAELTEAAEPAPVAHQGVDALYAAYFHAALEVMRSACVLTKLLSPSQSQTIKERIEACAILEASGQYFNLEDTPKIDWILQQNLGAIQIPGKFCLFLYQWEYPATIKNWRHSSTSPVPKGDVQQESQSTNLIEKILDTITISGYDTCFEAISCEQYVRNRWGNVGIQVATFLTKVAELVPSVDDELESQVQIHTVKLVIKLDHISEFTCKLVAYAFPSHVCLVVQNLDDPQVRKIQEVAQWMCQTFRPIPKPNELGVLRISKFIQSTNLCSQANLEAKAFRLLPLQPLEIDRADCWTALFESGIVAETPFSEMSELEGIEMSFDLMTNLAAVETYHYLEHGGNAGGLILLGFFTALVPVRFHHSGAIQWHFEYSETDILRPMDLKSAQEPWAFANAPSELSGRRCVIGIWPQANIMLGVQGTRLDFEDSGLPHRSSVLRPKGFEVTAGLGSSGGPVQGIGQVTRTYEHVNTRQRFSRADAYVTALNRLSQAVSLVYDCKTHTGWLVPQMSLLLHLCHAYWARSITSKQTDPIPWAKPSTDGASAALDAFRGSGDIVVSEVGDQTDDQLLLRQLLVNLNSNLQITHDTRQSPKKILHWTLEIYLSELQDQIREPGEGSALRALKLSEWPSIEAWLDITQKVDGLLVCKNLDQAIVLVAPSSSTSATTTQAAPTHPVAHPASCSCAKVPEGRGYLVAHAWCLQNVLKRPSPAASKDKVTWIHNGKPLDVDSIKPNECIWTHPERVLQSFGKPGPGSTCNSSQVNAVEGAVVFGKYDEGTFVEWFKKLKLQP